MHPTFARLSLHLSLALAALGAATLSSAAGLGSNLVVNGTAETDTTSWTAFDGVDLFSAVDYGSNWVLPTEPGPVDRGSKLFVGGSGVAYAAGYQDADLGGISSSDLAQGQLGYALSGWLGGWLAQTDSATFTVQFLDVQSSVLGNAVLGPSTPDYRNNVTGLFLYTANGSVPLNTTSIRFVLEMSRNSGSDNDGYVDNLSFALNPVAVPEPASGALLLVGIASLGLCVARRRAA
jgi:hypothetical protein